MKEAVCALEDEEEKEKDRAIKSFICNLCLPEFKL